MTWKEKIMKTTVTLLSLVLATTAFSDTSKSETKTESAVAQTAVAIDQSKVADAEARLAKLKKYFGSNAGSVEVVFRSLNGHDATNTPGQREAVEGDFKSISDPENGVSGVKCIQDSKFVATNNPRQLDATTANWKDSHGNLVLPTFVGALKANKEKGLAHVTYTETVANEAGGTTQLTRTAVIASSSWLLGAKNTSGKKFLCYITVE